MKTNLIAFCLIAAILCAVSAGCGNSGGMSVEEMQRETNAALSKQDNVGEETERLRRELSQIPAQEKLTKTPYKIGNTYILEKDSGGEYDFIYHHDG